jgi:hypothetical protein
VRFPAIAEEDDTRPGAIILIMHRLHGDDLAGHVMAQDERAGHMTAPDHFARAELNILRRRGPPTYDLCTVCLGGLPAFAARLSNDKVAPFPAIRESILGCAASRVPHRYNALSVVRPDDRILSCTLGDGRQ